MKNLRKDHQLRAHLEDYIADLVKNSSGIDRKPFSHGKFGRNWTFAGLSFQFSVLSSQSALRKFAVTAH